MNSTAVGDFFLNLLEKNDVKGLYGGDIIKAVDVINQLYNRSKNNELHEENSTPVVAETLIMVNFLMLDVFLFNFITFLFSRLFRKDCPWM